MKIRKDLETKERGFENIKAVEEFIESNYFNGWSERAKADFYAWCLEDKPKAKPKTLKKAKEIEEEIEEIVETENSESVEENIEEE